MKSLFAAVLLQVLCFPAGAQSAEPGEVPRHLAIARELVDNVKPEDNRYVLGARSISFPGDLFSKKYSVQADCSGFLLAIFDRANYPTQRQMRYLEGGARRTRPASEDFVYSIEQEKGFRRIRSVEDMKPGDLLAHAMLDKADQKEVGTTGHVFLINSVPKPIQPRPPVVQGTRQYEVSVIDSNNEHVGADDSRLADPAMKVAGLGRGTIRLYVDESGELVGWARTFRVAKSFFSYDPRFPSGTRPRKAAIGRPLQP